MYGVCGAASRDGCDAGAIDIPDFSGATRRKARAPSTREFGDSKNKTQRQRDGVYPMFKEQVGVFKSVAGLYMSSDADGRVYYAVSSRLVCE